MARNTNAFSLTKIIAERRADLASARASVNRLQDNAPAFRAALHVVNMVANYASDLEFTRWANVNTYSTSDGQHELNVNLEGYVDSLKQGAIIALIERAMDCGFEAVGSKDYLSNWASQRSFKFTQSIAGVLIELCITANIKDSETCRKVQVGTKLEEVAQYEIVCS